MNEGFMRLLDWPVGTVFQLKDGRWMVSTNNDVVSPGHNLMLKGCIEIGTGKVEYLDQEETWGRGVDVSFLDSRVIELCNYLMRNNIDPDTGRRNRISIPEVGFE